MSAPQAVASGPERREEITAQIVARTGITEAMIEQLVRAFYDKVRADAVLGPIFEARIRDWEPHLAQMFAFWSSVALMTGRYHGTPMVKHNRLPVDAGHFDRGRRIASSLEMGVAGTHGVILGKGERFRRSEAGAVG